MEQFDSQVCEESFLTFSDIEIESHMAGHSISTFEGSMRLFPPPATSTMRETQLLAQEVQMGSMALDFYGLERSVATVYQSMHNKSEKPNNWDTTTLSCPLLSQPQAYQISLPVTEVDAIKDGHSPANAVGFCTQALTQPLSIPR